MEKIITGKLKIWNTNYLSVYDDKGEVYRLYGFEDIQVKINGTWIDTSIIFIKDGRWSLRGFPELTNIKLIGLEVRVKKQEEILTGVLYKTCGFSLYQSEEEVFQIEEGQDLEVKVDGNWVGVIVERSNGGYFDYSLRGLPKTVDQEEGLEARLKGRRMWILTSRITVPSSVLRGRLKQTTLGYQLVNEEEECLYYFRGGEQIHIKVDQNYWIYATIENEIGKWHLKDENQQIITREYKVIKESEDEEKKILYLLDLLEPDEVEEFEAKAKFSMEIHEPVLDTSEVMISARVCNSIKKIEDQRLHDYYIRKEKGKLTMEERILEAMFSKK